MGLLCRKKVKLGRSHGLPLVEQQELGLMNGAASKHKILDLLIAQITRVFDTKFCLNVVFSGKWQGSTTVKVKMF
jgi:hypothetical protein